MLFYEERVIGPHIDILLTELLELRVMSNNRVDHPRKGGKDLSDAMCGSISNPDTRGPLIKRSKFISYVYKCLVVCSFLWGKDHGLLCTIAWAVIPASTFLF